MQLKSRSDQMAQNNSQETSQEEAQRLRQIELENKALRAKLGQIENHLSKQVQPSMDKASD